MAASVSYTTAQLAADGSNIDNSGTQHLGDSLSAAATGTVNGVDFDFNTGNCSETFAEIRQLLPDPAIIESRE